MSLIVLGVESLKKVPGRSFEKRKGRNAGLGVYEQEPLPEDHVFRELENLNLTPHLGASTAEAQESVGVEIAEAIAEVLNGGRIRNAINMPSIDPKDLESLSPYLDLCERLGAFARQAAQGSVEAIQITYYGGVVDFDCVPLTRAVQRRLAYWNCG